MRSESLDAVAASGTHLRVEFVWHGDRYGHRISLVAEGGVTPLLESIEGTPADDWPPSPPLQSLHRELLPSGRTALLLVGSAGRSHWSASIEAAVGQVELTFDVACRHGGEAGGLGSCYLAQPGAGKLLTIASNDARVSWHGRRLEIKPMSDKAATTRWRFSASLNRGPVPKATSKS